MATKEALSTDGLTGVDSTHGVSETSSFAGTTAKDRSLHNGELVVGDLGSDVNHIFSDPRVAEYWRGVYEKANYECRHRFDPQAIWSAEEEKRLRRRVCPGFKSYHGGLGADSSR